MIKLALSLVGIDVLGEAFKDHDQLFAIECGLKGTCFLVGVGFLTGLVLMAFG